jgi:hypothetical protein
MPIMIIDLIIHPSIRTLLLYFRSGLIRNPIREVMTDCAVLCCLTG